jgi:acetate kinase
MLGAGVAQVAVFDTAFHRTLTEAACTYGGPYAWREEGIRRFGFHGISHQYTARRAEAMLGGRAGLEMVSCHLGSGCSLAAIRGGRSVDTTMGFTPLEGLVMGTRSGSVDPGVLVYLMRHKGVGVEELDRALNAGSGLLGLSGVAAGMEQVVEAMRRGNPRARLAFDVYVHGVRRHVGAMAASLERLEALVFTAGVGENSAEVRSAVCGGLMVLGVRLDEEKNRAAGGDRDIGAADSAARVLVIHTQEEWEIARECGQVVEG